MHDALGSNGLPYWKTLQGFITGRLSRDELDGLVCGWGASDKRISESVTDSFHFWQSDGWMDVSRLGWLDKGGLRLGMFHGMDRGHGGSEPETLNHGYAH